ncbi:HpcH/HpaI aldolase/citrate lyase family protein [Haloferax profundi]|uniref:Citryl-CoA lyase n=1 Tax=Haloferax profundi TaxID=1544718 RepID=A0A0W1RFN0_9EURY|nr:CoA ester lyase [Haloferax profundi]KTG12210.1 citryl-CoA lyase [Haloferax profundi]
MVRRSLLFSPGDRAELLQKAPSSGADTLIFDLEDAVAPSQKESARATVRDVLADPSFNPEAEIVVRINEEIKGQNDIAALEDAAPDAVMVPKVSNSEDLSYVEDILQEHNVDCTVFALVESAKGVLNAPEIASAPVTSAVALGAEDLAVDLGASRSADGTEILYARERIVLAASAAGIDAIDTPYTTLRDNDGLRADAKFARDIGFDGKLAIHPKQVSRINEAFTPNEDRVMWARRVVEAWESAEQSGRGVVEVDGEMIDAPLLEQAQEILRRTNVDD